MPFCSYLLSVDPARGSEIFNLVSWDSGDLQCCLLYQLPKFTSAVCLLAITSAISGDCYRRSQITSVACLPKITCVVSLPEITCVFCLPEITCVVCLPEITCVVSLPDITCVVSGDCYRRLPVLSVCSELLNLASAPAEVFNHLLDDFLEVFLAFFSTGSPSSLLQVSGIVC